MAQCTNQIWDSYRHFPCTREAKAGEELCGFCLGAKKRGVLASEKARARYDATTRRQAYHAKVRRLEQEVVVAARQWMHGGVPDQARAVALMDALGRLEQAEQAEP